MKRCLMFSSAQDCLKSFDLNGKRPTHRPSTCHWSTCSLDCCIPLVVARTVSGRERNEPPDIDIDFEHERREEVIQYLYGKYGRDRAALTAVIISYRPKSALRDVGKALGFELEALDALCSNLQWWDGSDTCTSRSTSYKGQKLLNTCSATWLRWFAQS